MTRNKGRSTSIFYGTLSRRELEGLGGSGRPTAVKREQSPAYTLLSVRANTYVQEDELCLYGAITAQQHEMLNIVIVLSPPPLLSEDTHSTPNLKKRKLYFPE